MRRDYPRMSIEDFGRQLLETGDLDPVYLALNAAGLDGAARNRFLCAYSAFYHCGVASYMADHADPLLFWAEMKIAADNFLETPTHGRWPRGSERRHFRGGQALAAISDWSTRHPDPVDMYRYIAGPSLYSPFEAIRQRAQEHRSVGNWLGFKAVDLVDATMGVMVDQSDIGPFFYDTPRDSALNLWRTRQGLPENARPKDEVALLKSVTDALFLSYEDLENPHKPDRPVDMFCIETILCKYQSHLNGHYPIWHDTVEITGGLMPWLDVSETANKFYDAMPRGKAATEGEPT